MRGLSQRFIDDLTSGYLHSLRDRVIADTSVCLEIRNDYLNVYYRGGSLMRLSASDEGYVVSFDTKYAMDAADEMSQRIPNGVVKKGEDVEPWISMIPSLKLAMDLHRGKHPKEEREAQHLIIRDNNFGGVGRKTDFYICDIEYDAAECGRFDMVAVHWPSNRAIRKNPKQRRLALVEVKYGDNAIDGNSGIYSHISEINKFIEKAENLQTLKHEMVGLFNQKRALGLVDCGKGLVTFSDEPPMLVLALINHDPDSKLLRRSLEALPPCPHADVYLATGCLMGYGLFDQAVLPLDIAIDRLGAQI